MKSLIKFSPRRELSLLHKTMDELFEDTMGFGRRGFVDRGFEPLVDILEDKDAIELKVELPGMDQKDVKVVIENNVLHIKGEKKFEDEEKRENYHKIERYYGAFSRSFTLPTTIKQEDITFEKGLLKLTLPKSEETKPKTIEIDVK
jgi:HSP20 family protein